MPAAPATQRLRRVIALALVAVFVSGGFAALGIWQVHRLGWKHRLIATVDSRIHAPPQAAPGRSDWSSVDGDAYRHVRVTGHYLANAQTRVITTTRLGIGAWVLTPLQTEAGFIVLVNRGFVADLPQAAAPPPLPAPPTGQVTVTGLLRLSEPRGSFLRANVPADNRWYSRDVTAIAAARGLPANRVAPYFIDADATPVGGDTPPVAGLTVVHFPDNHLQYAITWFVLAGLTWVGFAVALRRGRGRDDLG